MRIAFFIVILTFLFSFHLDAYVVSSGPSSFAPSAVDVGAEVLFLRRIRRGGTRQDGRLEGVFCTYDYLRRATLYVGGEFNQACGEISGFTGRGSPLVSHIKDRLFEGRIGYTFQNLKTSQTFFTPFLGYGYFDEKNQFKAPSPIPILYHNTYHYALLGFLTGADLNDWVGFWINFKTRFMIDGKVHTSNDPYREDATLKMTNETAFCLDAPLIISPPWVSFFLKLTIAPFYEYRHYGGREGYPYNYHDTKINLIGARAGAMLRF